MRVVFIGRFFCDDFVAAPFHRFNVPEREKIRKALEALPFCPELKP